MPETQEFGGPVTSATQSTTRNLSSGIAGRADAAEKAQVSIWVVANPRPQLLSASDVQEKRTAALAAIGAASSLTEYPTTTASPATATQTVAGTSATSTGDGPAKIAGHQSRAR